PGPAAAAGPADQGPHTSVLPRPAGAGSAHLVDRNGHHHPLRGTATIGRLPECEVTLDDASVSRRHARVERNGDGWSITDLGSTNGVKVNGESVRSATLRDGDRLQLGSLALTFSSGG
ncbi:MAG: FHA domain-containing protein, partial [Actinomycetota bacterium]|nr:FHA domain-containing protein [Actinomycetota bacterium]